MCGMDKETWYKVKLYTFLGVMWAGVLVVGCIYILYAPLAYYDESAKGYWKKRHCLVASSYISTTDPSRRLLAHPDGGAPAWSEREWPVAYAEEARRRLDDADDSSLTYYAVLQVTVYPTRCSNAALDDDGCVNSDKSYITNAVKFPSWASGAGGSSLHGWEKKSDAKNWAKGFETGAFYTCWKRPSDKGTVAISNPGYHYDWEIAIGMTALALTAAPIGAGILLCFVMYYILVIKPQRVHRAEAKRLAKLRARGSKTLKTEMV